MTTCRSRSTSTRSSSPSSGPFASGRSPSRSSALRARAVDEPAEPARRRTRPGVEPELVGRGAAMRGVFKAIGLASRDRRHRPDHRRERDRQGAGRRGAAPALGAVGRPVRPGPLRRPAGGPDRERAVRPRAGRLHRRRPPEREGRFERAAGGTIFLDEVGELSHRPRRSSSSASSSSASSNASAGPRRSAPTRGWSPRRTATCPPRSPPAGSARTCTTASTSPGLQHPAAPRPPRGHPDLLAERRPPPGRAAPGLGRAVGLAPRPSTPSPRRPWPGNVRQLENALAQAVIRSQGRTDPPRTPRRRPHRRGRRRRRSPAADDPAGALPTPRPAGAGGAVGDPPRLDRQRREPDPDSRAARHQPPPAFRQDPRVRPPSLKDPGGEREHRYQFSRICGLIRI